MKGCTKVYDRFLKKDIEEILTITEVKNYLKLDGHCNEKFLTELITAVRESAEKFLNITIARQEFEQVNYNLIENFIELRCRPIVKINNVSIVNKSGERSQLSSKKYIFDECKNTLLLKSENTAYALAVSYLAGFDKDTVPSAIKTGMLLHIESVYDKGTLNNIPEAVVGFYKPYRQFIV
jgi:uncharacterized phiE125 gp8 family phage protein